MLNLLICNLIIECTHSYTCIWTSLECDMWFCIFTASWKLYGLGYWGEICRNRIYCVKIKCKLHRDSKNANMLRSLAQAACALWSLRKRTCSRPAGRLSRSEGRLNFTCCSGGDQPALSSLDFRFCWKSASVLILPFERGLDLLMFFLKCLLVVAVFLTLCTGLQAWAPTPG